MSTRSGDSSGGADDEEPSPESGHAVPSYDHAPPTVNMQAVRRQRGEPELVTAPRTMIGMGAVARPGAQESAAASSPTDAPRVEISQSLQLQALQRSVDPAPPAAHPPLRRNAGAPTDVMPAVQRKREEQQADGSDLPLKLGLAALGCFILLLMAAVVYGVVAYL